MDRDIHSVTGQVAKTIINDKVVYQIKGKTAWELLMEEAPKVIHSDLQWILDHSNHVSAKELLWAWKRKTLRVSDKGALLRQNQGLHYGTAWTVLIFMSLTCVGLSELFKQTHAPYLPLFFPVVIGLAFWCLAYTAWPQITAKHAIKALQDKPSPSNPRKLSPAQQVVLTQIRRLPRKASEDAFAFMEEHFGTRLVYEMQPDQLRRLKGYVDGIYRNRQANQQRKNAA